MRFCFTFRPRFSSAVKAAFLDRDGVINVDYAYVHSRENFHFIPGALEGAAELVRKGHQLIIVTNQSGIGRGKYSIDQFRELTFWLAGVFARNHAPLSAVYFCPHHPTHAFAPYLKDCDCRKPNPGMLLQAARDLNIDLTQSVLIGDINFRHTSRKSRRSFQGCFSAVRRHKTLDRMRRSSLAD